MILYIRKKPQGSQRSHFFKKILRGSYPLGGQSRLWFQEQQMRFGLQQGASGLRHLPSLQHRGVEENKRSESAESAWWWLVKRPGQLMKRAGLTWSNYNDFTWPHLIKVAEEGKSLAISGKSRLVKYYNLARINHWFPWIFGLSLRPLFLRGGPSFGGGVGWPARTP